MEKCRIWLKKLKNMAKIWKSAEFVWKREGFIEGSLEVKLPTIWRDEKQSREEA